MGFYCIFFWNFCLGRSLGSLKLDVLQRKRNDCLTGLKSHAWQSSYSCLIVRLKCSALLDDRLKNRKTIKIKLFLYIYSGFFLLNNSRSNMHFNQKASELFCWVRETRTNLVFFSMHLSVYIQKVRYTVVLAKAKLFLDYLGKLPLDKSHAFE